MQHILEAFIQEERRQAELRLSQEEVLWLQHEYNAVCTAMDDLADDSHEKQWYLVVLP